MKTTFQKFEEQLQIITNPEWIRDYVLFKNIEHTQSIFHNELLEKVNPQVHSLEYYVDLIKKELDETLMTLISVEERINHIEMSITTLESISLRFSLEMLGTNAGTTPLRQSIFGTYKYELELYYNFVRDSINILEHYYNEKKNFLLTLPQFKSSQRSWKDEPFEGWFKTPEVYEKVIEGLVSKGICVKENMRLQWDLDNSYFQNQQTLDSKQKKSTVGHFAGLIRFLCFSERKKYLRFDPVNQLGGWEPVGKKFTEHFFHGKLPVSRNFNKHKIDECSIYEQYYVFLNKLVDQSDSTTK
jgi:hypothetical protein